MFTSGTNRFKTGTYVQENAFPGPSDYDPATAQPKYMIKGPVDIKFGAVADRTSLLHRNVSKSPFKNPTAISGPSPTQYAPNMHEISKNFQNSPSGNIVTANNRGSNLGGYNSQSGSFLNSNSTEEIIL